MCSYALDYGAVALDSDPGRLRLGRVSRAHFAAMARAIAAHHLEPVIDRVIDFDEAPAAYHCFQDTPLGKVVIAHT
jgi:NADPH:quinone reductase-like Zn-dependent oxidoreductase